jgi:hypothetical protein
VGQVWDLAVRGKLLKSIPHEDRYSLLRKFAIEVPIVCIALRLVESKKSQGISFDELTKEMIRYSDLNHSTPRRRVECILSWLQQLDLVEKTRSKSPKYVHHSLLSQTKLI